MPKNVFNPRSREQSQQNILRTMDGFSGGMSRDTKDKEFPTKESYSMVNVRGFEDSLHGRYGTEKWTTTKRPQTIHYTDPETELVDGRLFYLETNNNIFIGDKITIEYSTDGMTTIQTMEVFVIGIERRYKSFQKPDRLYTYDKIVINGEFPPNSDIKSIHGSGAIRGTVEDVESGIFYYIIGDSFYLYRNSQFIKYNWNNTGIDFDNDIQLYIIGSFVVIVTSNGIFTTTKYNKDNSHFSVWRMDVDTPKRKINQNVEIKNPNFAYNYAYTYTRMRDSWEHNRNYIDDIMVVETPPNNHDEFAETKDGIYKPTVNTKPYSSVYSSNKIDVGRHSRIIFIKSPNEFKDLVSDGIRQFFRVIKVNYITDDQSDFNVYIEVSDIWNYEDLAKEIDRQLKEIDRRYFCNVNDDGAYIGSSEDDIVLYVKQDTGYSGDDYDLLEHVYIGQDNNYGFPANGLLVKYLYPPETSGECDDFTHYSIYRTKNIFNYTELSKNRITDISQQHNPDFLGWVEDVPAIKMSTYTNVVTEGGSGEFLKLTIDNKDFPKKYDVGSSVVVVDDTSTPHYFTIVEVDPATSSIFLPSSGVNIVGTTGEVYLGATYYGKVKTASTQTLLPSYEHQAFHEVIFEKTGYPHTISPGANNALLFVKGGFLRLYEYNNKYYVLDRINDFILYGYYPTRRNFYDSMTDNKLGGNRSVWSLDTIYYKKIPSVRLSQYHKGVLITAEFDDLTKYNYTTTAEFRYLGYYREGYQYNTSIRETITSLYPIQSMIAIHTAYSTYTVSPMQSNLIDRNNGDVFVQLPAPAMCDDSVGVLDNSHVTRGPKNSIIVFSNEPAIRVFDGKEYSDDITYGNIRHSHIARLAGRVVMHYNTNLGLLIWGSNSDEGKDDE